MVKIVNYLITIIIILIIIKYMMLISALGMSNIRSVCLVLSEN